jgi:hypothetical protein
MFFSKLSDLYMTIKLKDRHVTLCAHFAPWKKEFVYKSLRSIPWEVGK